MLQFNTIVYFGKKRIKIFKKRLTQRKHFGRNDDLQIMNENLQAKLNEVPCNISWTVIANLFSIETIMRLLNFAFEYKMCSLITRERPLFI